MNLVLSGTRAAYNQPPVCAAPFVTFTGTHNKKPARFSLTKKQLSKNILYLGGTGSGKTNTINMSVEQIKRAMGPDDVMIIFDTKGDFERRFFDRSRDDRIIGNSAKYRARSEKWNVYREITADGSDEDQILQNINEIAHSLFIRNQSAQNPFFPNAARNVFSGYLLAMLRTAGFDDQIRRELLFNKQIAHYFNVARQEQYDALAQSYDDLNSLKLYLGDYDNNQALGVLSEILNMVKDTFVGVFGDTGNFSIREFVRRRGGRTLFLEYDLAIGQTLSPLYSLLLDLALKEALSQNEDPAGNVYIIVDEFKLVPYTQHMDDAVNFGRSRGLSIQAGLQSLSQIYENYGDHKGGALLSGFSTLIAFHPNDAASRDFIRNHFGQNYVNEIINAQASERRVGYTVEDWELSSLRLGDAVVGIDGADPFLFHFDEFK